MFDRKFDQSVKLSLNTCVPRADGSLIIIADEVLPGYQPRPQPYECDPDMLVCRLMSIVGELGESKFISNISLVRAGIWNTTKLVC